jgi:ATP-dependent Clp protease adaptor protein ClpS
MWNIVFYNDDYTPIDFVQFVLMKVFRRSIEDALALTMAVHTEGKGIAGTYTFEVAEQKQCDVLLMAKIEEHPLRVEVERVWPQAEIPVRHGPRASISYRPLSLRSRWQAVEEVVSGAP